MCKCACVQCRAQASADREITRGKAPPINFPGSWVKTNNNALKEQLTAKKILYCPRSACWARHMVAVASFRGEMSAKYFIAVRSSYICIEINSSFIPYADADNLVTSALVHCWFNLNMHKGVCSRASLGYAGGACMDADVVHAWHAGAWALCRRWPQKHLIKH